MHGFISLSVVAFISAGLASAHGQAVQNSGAQEAPAAETPAPAPEDRVYRGACDGSAAVMLNDTHFAAAYDEDNMLRIFPLAGGADIGSGRLDVGAHLGIGGAESDLEGGVAMGDRIYWIGSMGENGQSEEKPERRRFFGTQIVESGARLAPIGTPAAAASENLFRAMLEAPELLAYELQAAAREATKTVRGLNVEGLAATSEGGVMIGFRGPLHPLEPAGDRRAIVVTLSNPSEVIEGGAPRFANAGAIRLGDRGIRSLEFLPASGDYLILAGSVDSARNFALFRWSGRLADDPVLMPVNLDPLNPEALALLPDGRLLVLSDDGEEQIDGRNCKSRHTPPERRSFRGRIISLPQAR